ncbi:hypothetical protein MHZ36_04360 [Staphylococcus sp. ACRSN]|uniref:hypothetical protein n=1 Tax=Staphylococcus sp. ACRSN TaxID=2918214 RepID=UPI001EF2878B|nr:hypothetical protein [Staphylococcus sp. ACRSN]MCG7338513.1 hypothetical protein [Staphylococcus sp. ACRSN]
MVFSILIIFLLLNILPAIYYGKQYFDLKKKKSSDKEFKKLTDSMMNADKLLIPISIITVLILYFIQK